MGVDFLQCRVGCPAHLLAHILHKHHNQAKRHFTKHRLIVALERLSQEIVLIQRFFRLAKIDQGPNFEPPDIGSRAFFLVELRQLIKRLLVGFLLKGRLGFFGNRGRPGHEPGRIKPCERAQESRHCHSTLLANSLRHQCSFRPVTLALWALRG
jgi:hypothetical protein